MLFDAKRNYVEQNTDCMKHVLNKQTYRLQSVSWPWKHKTVITKSGNGVSVRSRGSLNSMKICIGRIFVNCCQREIGSRTLTALVIGPGDTVTAP